LFFVLVKTPKSKEMKKMKGTIKWYNSRKGYGFIEGEDGKDVFVHRTALPEGIFLDEGDKVEYEIEEGDKGPNAKDIKKL
jgi:CspA family cold shock protein